jgi:folate-binding protein YgfZ
MGVAMTEVNEREYNAIRDGTAILPLADASPLIVRGADRFDFLHRMTTNDINSLRPGQSMVTVLTTPAARIRFVFTVVCREDDLLVLPSQGESQTLASHLRSQIFFMDQVEIATLGAGRWRVVGAGAESALSGYGYLGENASDGAWWVADSALFVRQDGYELSGYEMVAPGELAERIVDKLTRGGVLLSDSAAYEARRVELGRPAPGHELVEAYTPLEAGLAWACSDRKGCYTGQEIIARQVTYDKVTKGLAGLDCDDTVAEGEAVQVDGKPAGMVTSAAYSPSLGKQLALAVLQRPHNAPGTVVSVMRMDGSAVHATVAPLPFQ